jgi:hypothetical protein
MLRKKRSQFSDMHVHDRPHEFCGKNKAIELLFHIMKEGCLEVEAYEKNSQGRPDPKHLKAHLQY